MQELNEPSISKELSKANKVAELVDDTTTLADDKSDTSNVNMVDFN
jgi:hypothetical protein